MSVAVFNRRWATLILESLTRHQVKHVCIAPGSRSTALTLAAAAHPHLICHTHFDERGLGHLALGLAKASGTPVAVIVTSGTAVANLYPALIEASLTGEKLVLLTADRPPELIDCGANQAIRQPGMFASYPVQALDLPRPTLKSARAGWCRPSTTRWRSKPTALSTLTVRSQNRFTARIPANIPNGWSSSATGGRGISRG